MADKRYGVALYDQEIGFITSRGGLTTFEFLDAYLDDPGRAVLGQKFEEDLRGRWRQQGRVPVWFSNLLPEEDGLLREFLAQHLGIDPAAELDLLVALGADLPGAVTILGDSDVSDNALRAERSEAVADSGATDDQASVRFSAAGIQLKLSMISERNSVRLPGQGELGGHFVKFAGTLPRLPNNEFTMMTLASAVGLNVPRIDLRPVADISALPRSLDRLKGTDVYVIERFDRSPAGERIHIEDLNQVLGQWPGRKYERASYEGVGRLFLTLCGEDDFWEYLDRLAFSIAIGNEDAHLKNWSIIYGDRRTPRIAPLYDVVSTVIVPGLDRGLALSIGGEKRAQALTWTRLKTFSEKIGIRPADVEVRVRDFLRRIYEAESLLRSDDRGLLTAEWESIDAYRLSVPILADAMRS